MSVFYTEYSKAILQLIEDRSDVTWISGDVPTKETPVSYFLFLNFEGVDELAYGNDVCKSKETYITPEEFVMECARRKPKSLFLRLPMNGIG